MTSLLRSFRSRAMIGLVVVGSALLSACMSGVKMDSHRLGDALQVDGVSQVEVTLSPQASAQLADNGTFSGEVFLGFVQKKFEAQGWLNPVSPYRAEVQVTDLRFRSSFSAVVFGIFAGQDHLSGNVRLKDASGQVLRSFDVNASYFLGGVAGFNGFRVDWLYDRFAQLAVTEMTKSVLAQNARSTPAPLLPATLAASTSAAPTSVASTGVVPTLVVPTQGSTDARADLALTQAVPLINERCRAIYKDDWLARDKPRAFVVDSSGRCFGAWGSSPSNAAEASDPGQRAMARCRAAGLKACMMYALDDSVVSEVKR
jgi:predicted small secreted protein